MAGWLVGLAALTIVFAQVPHLVDGFGQASPRWAPWVRIAIGVVLILFGVGRWATRNRATREPALLNRPSRITPVSAAVIGFVLMVINPKVVVMNAAAGLIIGTAAVGFGIWAAVLLFTVLAGSTVIAPILAYQWPVSASIRSLERMKDWMQREHAAVAAVILAIVGVLLTYTGIRAL